jgi:chromosome segregation protein
MRTALAAAHEAARTAEARLEEAQRDAMANRSRAEGAHAALCEAAAAVEAVARADLEALPDTGSPGPSASARVDAAAASESVEELRGLDAQDLKQRLQAGLEALRRRCVEAARAAAEARSRAGKVEDAARRIGVAQRALRAEADRIAARSKQLDDASDAEGGKDGGGAAGMAAQEEALAASHAALGAEQARLEAVQAAVEEREAAVAEAARRLQQRAAMLEEEAAGLDRDRSAVEARAERLQAREREASLAADGLSEEEVAESVLLAADGLSEASSPESSRAVTGVTVSAAPRSAPATASPPGAAQPAQALPSRVGRRVVVRRTVRQAPDAQSDAAGDVAAATGAESANAPSPTAALASSSAHGQSRGSTVGKPHAAMTVQSAGNAASNILRGLAEGHTTAVRRLRRLRTALQRLLPAADATGEAASQRVRGVAGRVRGLTAALGEAEGEAASLKLELTRLHSVWTAQRAERRRTDAAGAADSEDDDEMLTGLSALVIKLQEQQQRHRQWELALGQAIRDLETEATTLDGATANEAQAGRAAEQAADLDDK